MCRAFLSPYYERGGFYPADENDRPIFTGRWNAGAISLNLPMILAKSRKESKDFYEVLDYYLEMIRNLHKRTKEYLGELHASINPLAYCEGGFYKGQLKPHDKIRPLLEYVTFSFGITALNELNQLYNKKSITEDGDFPLEVMRYINDKITEYKNEDHMLYAIYGTPAESLCHEGNTLVQTYKGHKKIKDITTDDLVYTYNESEKKVELKRVLRVGKTKKDAEVVNVTTTNGQSFICTPTHPFGLLGCDNDISYTPASLLQHGDKIQTRSSEDVQVESVEYLDETYDVYNMTVEDNSNYFIGGDQGVLVHNCGTQVQQFRKIYGVVENVSDREYVSNSFHCHVTEDINPIEKQDKELRFWNLFAGGRIQYVKYPIDYNLNAIASLVRRAMANGLYEGVNLSLAYCNECGHEELKMDICPKCGSKDLTKVERMNGYLSFSRVHGDTRLNAAKMAEIADRKSM